MKKKKDPPLDEKALVDLTLGKRPPKNESERELLKEIEEIKAKGYIVEIPNEFL
jgi:hypothetical protein